MCHSKYFRKELFRETVNAVEVQTLKIKSNELFDKKTLTTICEIFHVNAEEITDIVVLKKGMTNRSYIFKFHEKRYIIRISGTGTEKLINRYQEKDVYETIKGQNICDPVVYINPENGYKITEYLENSRVCDPMNDSDVKRCMELLRKFHKKKLTVGHEFDIFGQIEKYQRLWGEFQSVYEDYEETKQKVYLLKNYIDCHVSEKVLTHIDAVPDNFLFVNNEDGQEDIRLIDWEYAGMQDPHVDIAMFGIYSLYNRLQMEQLIDAYFAEGCPKEIRIKIHCYIAVCGLLWSNWCEYKEKLGISFGEYATQQYQYAKEYSQFALEELEEMENGLHA